MMMWMWISMVLILVGAQLNAEIERHVLRLADLLRPVPYCSCTRPIFYPVLSQGCTREIAQKWNTRTSNPGTQDTSRRTAPED